MVRRYSMLEMADSTAEYADLSIGEAVGWLKEKRIALCDTGNIS